MKDSMKVKRIEYAGKRDVYNMEVEHIHSFIVNHGFVVHNCYDEVRYRVTMPSHKMTVMEV